MNYDIIGDIHGHAGALVELLKGLGYRQHSGGWRHPDRTAVFLGDFIDGGPEQIATVMLVRRMVDAGSALAVMGNHELDAVAWAQPDPDAPGEFLRTHVSCGDKNRKQHQGFLDEVDGRPALHDEVIRWFLTLPLWLELPEIRVVHACWHPAFREYIAPRLQPGTRLNKELMIPATRKPKDEAGIDTVEPSMFKAVEALLKGMEVSLPAGVSFLDGAGTRRSRARVRWWNSGGAMTYRSLSMIPDEQRRSLPETLIPEHARIGYSGDKVLFIGHYKLNESPAPLMPRMACVDYGIGYGGSLYAYRYEGEPGLEKARFISVGSRT
ncbi:MAG TPA: metallophosphoesterase [Anaeromyxobacteraceae bacterium]|nr:metallophosphoesterase [Anaeromyxobacteraceae bacterium]